MPSPNLSTLSSNPMQYVPWLPSIPSVPCHPGGYPRHPTSAALPATLHTSFWQTFLPPLPFPASGPMPSSHPALPPASSGPMEYLEEAASALVGKNFPSDKTDPQWMKGEPAGYKGADKREKDGGFHAKSY